jgi:signal transduction histidine kinase
MHIAQSFARDYTRMLIVLALPLIVLILAKLLFGVLPTHHYHPNRVAYNGEQVLLWLHVATGLSYVWISAVMAWLLYRVRDALPYHTVGIAFTAFIVSCGANHLAHVWTMFLPNHWAEATIKGVMAVSSVATALALPPVVPVVVGLVRSAQLSEQRAAEIRSRDEFLSVAAHEFKTPIASLSAYTQLLDRRLDAARSAHRSRRTGDPRPGRTPDRPGRNSA